MTIDIERIRAETPGCAHVVHLNNSGAGLMPQPVLDAVKDHLDLEARIGGYEACERADAAIENTYGAIAQMLNCHSDEIATVENATRGWDMAFYAMTFGPGDRILTAQAEYASNYIAFLQVARKTGAVIEAVPDDEHGQIDVAALANMIDDRVKLIAITHVPTNGGLVNPAAAVGRLARDAGVPYLLDACQSAGQMPLDVEEIGCDMLSATGRKFLRGPRGTGFLYVRRAMIEKLEPPFLDLHAATWSATNRYDIRKDARRFENWESYVAGRIGLGVAVDYALALGLDAIEARVTSLADGLRRRLADLPGATLLDLGEKRCGIVSFSLEGQEPEAVKSALAAQGINISTSTITSTRLEMESRGLEAFCRAGVHYYNTEEELDRLVDALRAL
jgi:selenocysteine lyase/cysteine desulfurase